MSRFIERTSVDSFLITIFFYALILLSGCAQGLDMNSYLGASDYNGGVAGNGFARQPPSGNLAISHIHGISDSQKSDLLHSVISKSAERGIALIPAHQASTYARSNINQHYLTAEFNRAPGVSSSVLYYIWNIYDPLGNKLTSIKGETIIENLESSSEAISLSGYAIKEIAADTAQKLSLWWVRYSAAYPNRALPARPAPRQPALIDGNLAQNAYNHYNPSLYNPNSPSSAYYNQYAPQHFSPPGYPDNAQRNNVPSYFPAPTSQKQILAPPSRFEPHNNNRPSYFPLPNRPAPTVTNSIPSGFRKSKQSIGFAPRVMFVADYAVGLEAGMARILMAHFKKNMRKNGFLITDDYELSPLKVAAQVKINALPNDIESIDIRWHLQDNDGSIIGVFSQQNEINRDFMRKNWSKIAAGATLAASQRIIAALNR